MKKVFWLILISIASYVSMVVGRMNDYPILVYLGVAIGCALALGLVVWLLKMTAKFVGWATTSLLYLFMALVIMGFLVWYDVVPAFVCYIMGVVFSACLALTFIRRLARWAQKSMVGGEIFSFLSNYQIRSFIKDDTLIPKETQVNLSLDYKNIIVVLKDLGFNTSSAKDAATYVVSELPANASFEDRVREAIKYLGDNGSVEIYKARQN